MAYGKLNIGIRQFTKLRGDSESDGFSTSEFVIETEIQTREISPKKVKNLIVKGAEKVIKKELGNKRIKIRRR